MEVEIAHQFAQEAGKKIIDYLRLMAGKVLQLSGKPAWRAIVGHASSSGIEIVSPLAKEFAEKGGKVRFIIGMDYDKDAERSIRRLWELQKEIQWQFGKESFKARLFFSPNKDKIMHIKMHWMLSGESRNEAHYVLIGSQNLSKGGLSKNSELAVCLSLSPKDMKEIMEFQKIWEKYRDSKNAIPIKTFIQKKVLYWKGS
ncbi:MAG: phospholipase D family protein [Candidatus Micrarchaeota archaeon]|nr:phospholipase D family protein [Candidatus Micrarchaeota archaeon]